jgi:aspartyl-tRNA(Asn)/glutamyl-tRNA(Gln) amidotransferase subunit A
VLHACWRYTHPWNLTGLPALSVPCGFADGLPVGLQLVGKPFGEATILRVGQAYQQATRWHEQHPADPAPGAA